MPSSIAGLLGAYIGQHKAQEASQRHIKITRVESSTVGAVRVVLEVNGQAYSYPSRAVWADVAPSMSQESFPLPIGGPPYSIHFSAYVRDDSSGDVRFLNTQQVQTATTASPPFESQVRLHPVDKEFSRQAVTSLTISYSIY